MRRAKFSWVAHWRELYATGEIDLDEFERLIVTALRAERAPRSERPERKSDRSPKACAERWSAGAARSAARYAEGVSVYVEQTTERV